MKVNLSGKDWLVSPFLPNEAGGHYTHIKEVVAGNMYGEAFIPATVPGDVQMVGVICSGCTHGHTKIQKNPILRNTLHSMKNASIRCIGLITN